MTNHRCLKLVGNFLKLEAEISSETSVRMWQSVHGHGARIAQ